MVRDATWVRSQLELVKRKRALLKMLEGKLAAWGEQANFSGICNCLEGLKNNNG